MNVVLNLWKSGKFAIWELKSMNFGILGFGEDGLARSSVSGLYFPGRSVR